MGIIKALILRFFGGKIVFVKEKYIKADAMTVYRWLVEHCNSHLDNDGDCNGCIFDDGRPLCGCIANVPTE